MGGMIGIETFGNGGGGVIVIPETIERMRGLWTATVYDGDKEYNDCGRCITPVLFEVQRENLIVTVGKQLVLDRLFGLSGAIALAGTAVGTLATAAVGGDTAITGAVYKAFAATPTRTALSVTALTSYTTAEANISIQEVGLLTAAAGVLLNHVAPFLSFSKTTAVALDITTVISQS